MQGILLEIIEHKKQEVETLKKEWPINRLKERAAAAVPVRDFESALRRGSGPLKLLAEIKAASPSAGTIRESFDPAEVAMLFEHAGASAISVLTDFKYFCGLARHLQAAKQATTLPVLRKDFTIDEYQLYESRAIGADAILLMAQVLEKEHYKDLLQQAYEMGLHVLAEGHTAGQIEFLVEIGARVIGINNRDFDTMTVALNHTLLNRHLVPSDRVLVSQSGMFTREDIVPIDELGVDAIQVGTSIMQEEDMRGQVDRLLGK